MIWPVHCTVWIHRAADLYGYPTATYVDKERGLLTVPLKGSSLVFLHSLTHAALSDGRLKAENKIGANALHSLFIANTKASVERECATL